jgi:energy-coupling factor transport system ATP-binding protein
MRRSSGCSLCLGGEPALISLKNFTFSYKNGDEAKLNRASVAIEAGQFVLVCGATGSGKSTLLKALVGLVPHFSGGTASGVRVVDGQDFSRAMPHETAHLIGYVNQQPEGAFVADTVLEELAFALEQLAISRDEMIRRVDAALAATGLSELRNRKLFELSGGQQQRVAIAAALSAGQKILVLDEPTSALDPVSAKELLEFVWNLSRSEGITVIVAEHRIERLIDLVDSVIIVNNDGTVSQGEPQTQLAKFKFVPPLIEMAHQLAWPKVLLNIEQAAEEFARSAPHTTKRIAHLPLGAEVLNAERVTVDYGSLRAVDSVSLSAKAGEVIAVMGENGSGKTSLLWALQGTGNRGDGSISVVGQDPSALSATERLSVVAMVPQQAADLLFLPNLGDELDEADEVAEAKSASTSQLFEQFSGRIDPSIHPRDLSSGQQLSLVLAMQLVKNASLVILDEPTRGLDYAAKKQVAQVLRNLASAGKAVIFASHDVEFIAQSADRVIQLEAGKVIADQSVETALEYRADNSLASQVAQITKLPGVIALQQVVAND